MKPEFDIVLVLGPGRSGTSAVMRLLNLAGVALSGDLVPASEANPAGFWEDRFIVETHRGLLHELGCGEPIGNVLPLAPGWLEAPATAAAKAQLRAHIGRMRTAGRTWGVKDPRLSLLLPLWQALADELGLRLGYVLCLRHPASVAASMRTASGLDATIGEAVWLNRVAGALAHLREFCVVHYEELLARPDGVAAELVAYAGLERGTAPQSVGDVRPELNRAAVVGTPSNPLVADFYKVLRPMSGAAKRGAALSKLVAAHGSLVTGNAGWLACIARELGRAESARADAREAWDKRDQIRAALKQLRHRLNEALRRQELMKETNAALEKRAAEASAAHRDALEKLRAEIAETRKAAAEVGARLDRSRRDLEQSREAVARERNRIVRLETSRAYVLGRYFSEARWTAWGALKLPYRFWRLLFGPGAREQALKERIVEQRQSLDTQARKYRALAANHDDQRRRHRNLLREHREGRRRHQRLLAEQRDLLGRHRRVTVKAEAWRERVIGAGEIATSLGWGMKSAFAELLRPRLTGEAFEALARDFPLGARGTPSARPSVLYVGPWEFREGIWDTRAKYIFPDLFEEIADAADIHMITGPVPEFAAESLRALCDRFGIRHHALPPARYVGVSVDYWLTETLKLANRIRPSVITNIFGATSSGFIVGMVSRLLGSRGVLRVAGDELGVRRLLGTYRERPEKVDEDLLHYTLGMGLVDAVITMSPWEQARIRGYVSDADKVHVCMRGIDLARFAPRRTAGADGCRRFLYLGRKSIEKGYDLMEHAAAIVHGKAPEIEFLFAGNFDVEQIGNRNYLGFVQAENLPALFDSVDALVLPSRSEGFPQALGEAMAMGRPCIVPAQPFGTMFRHDAEVLLTEASAQSVADAVLRLHGDPALAARLAGASLRIAQDDLDRRKWKGIYRSILLGEPPGAGSAS